MTGTHRAVRVHAFGEPGEVLLRMRARPVNPSDLSLVRGRDGELPDLPATPGAGGARRGGRARPGRRDTPEVILTG